MITVFTPVYNRAYIIEKLYKSLRRQTSFEFEWLIVDDGSNDNVAELINVWIRDKTVPFEIRYYYQENGGKHRAVNKGVQLAKGEAFFIVDSDDYLRDDAIEQISAWWSQIAKDDTFAGISGLRCYESGEVIGGELPAEEYIDATLLEWFKYGIEGDKAEVYKTELLKQYPFPEYEGESFMSEDVVWYAIGGDGYKVRWYNKAIYVCEYLEDGLTRNLFELKKINPQGWAANIRVLRRSSKENEAQFMSEVYSFYEMERKILSRERLAELLDNDTELLEKVEKAYTYNLSQIEQQFMDMGCREVVIYAYGTYGKRFKTYLDALNIKVKYVLDRNYDEIKGIAAYAVGTEPPIGEAPIIIAVKFGEEKIYKDIVKHYPKQRILTLQDFGFRYWFG